MDIHKKNKPNEGKGLFDGQIHYCTRCCMPETNEGVVFDEMGICQACQSSEQKMHMDWAAKERELRKMLEHYKSLKNPYDCLIPISGGKDSTFQLHVITKIYGMRPLAVTFSHNWFTETGKYNLQNAIEKFSVDHIMFTPARNTVNKLARESLLQIGDSCWHCHAGVGAFPLQIAVRFKIPLLIWGESMAESSGRASYKNPVLKFDRDYCTKASARKTAKEMVNDNISKEEVTMFELPSYQALESVGVVGIHLGNYLFWDDERQMEFVRDVYDWREDKVEGTYKGYKSVECKMAGVHDYTKFLKRGFGRATDHASADVRAGLMTREEAFELAKKHDAKRPDALDFYLKITGFTEKEFHDIMKEYRTKVLGPKGITEADFADAIQRARTKS